MKYLELGPHMGRHYNYIKQILLKKGKEIGLSDRFISNMSEGLSHWVKGVDQENLSWGYYIFEKSNLLFCSCLLHI